MRILISTIVLAILPASWALGLTTTVSFQNGINGYTGTFDRYINDGTGEGAPANTIEAEANGADVQNYTLNGSFAGSGSPPTRQVATPDAQGLYRFDNIFGNGAGQIPSGAFILNAQMTLYTAGGNTSSAVGQSTINGYNGTSDAVITGASNPYGVSALTTPFDASTSYYTSYPNSLARGPYYTENSGEYAQRPLGGFPTAAVGQAVSANITPIVQQWSSGTLANNGVAVQAGFPGQSDDWTIHTTGFATPEARPKLSVTYTTDPITLTSFQPGVGSYDASNVTMARVVGTSPTISTPVTTDGSTITGGAGLDGPESPTPTTADQLALIKFSNIFGAGAGQAAPDKTVAKAWLVLTTDTGTNSRSNDPYDVNVMNRSWTTSSLYNDPLTFGSTPGLQVTDGDIQPVLDRQAAMASGSQVWFDVTSYVESIRNGAIDNGLSIRARLTDGWTLFFNGASDPSLRPRLVIASQASAGGLPGDFDGSGQVDAADYVAWRKGVVPTTAENYTLWRNNFGNSGTPSPAAPKPILAGYELYGLTTTNPVPATFAATIMTDGVTPMMLSRGSGISASGLTNGFAANNWATNSSKANAIAQNEYFQFGLTVDANHQASLASLDLALRRSALNAPMNFSLQVSLDGFATAGQLIEDFNYFGRVSGNAPDLDPTIATPFRYMTTDTGGRPDATITPGDQIPSIDLSVFPFLQNLGPGTVVTFRLYGWGNASTASTNTVAFGRVNGPVIRGTVIALSGIGSSLVPEPTSAAILTCYAFALGLFGRPRRKEQR